jgi:hypothetical protein
MRKYVMYGMAKWGVSLNTEILFGTLDAADPDRYPWNSERLNAERLHARRSSFCMTSMKNSISSQPISFNHRNSFCAATFYEVSNNLMAPLFIGQFRS